MTRGTLALIVTMVFTAIFVKNIVVNALLWREITPPDRNALLRF